MFGVGGEGAGVSAGGGILRIFGVGVCRPSHFFLTVSVLVPKVQFSKPFFRPNPYQFQTRHRIKSDVCEVNICVRKPQRILEVT